MSWFDEDPDMLYDTITSLEGTADRLVTLDGPYALFPDAVVRSPEEQHLAIREAASEAHIDLEAHTVSWAFPDEMAKRTKLFALAPNEGWLLWVDADEPVRYPDPNLTAILADTPYASATILMLEEDTGNGLTLQHENQHRPTQIDGRRVYEHPRIYRADLGLTVQGAHWQVTTRDGAVLWGRDHEHPQPTGLVLDHRTRERSLERQARAKAYYYLRDSLRLETQMCEVCRGTPSTTEACTPELDWMKVCDGCAATLNKDRILTQQQAGQQVRAYG
jgi:hypothetical protein